MPKVAKRDEPFWQLTRKGENGILLVVISATTNILYSLIEGRCRLQMNKIEISVFAFLFGMATMNEIRERKIKERIIDWLTKKSNEVNEKK